MESIPGVINFYRLIFYQKQKNNSSFHSSFFKESCQAREGGGEDNIAHLV